MTSAVVCPEVRPWCRFKGQKGRLKGFDFYIVGATEGLSISLTHADQSCKPYLCLLQAKATHTLFLNVPITFYYPNNSSSSYL